MNVTFALLSTLPLWGNESTWILNDTVWTWFGVKSVKTKPVFGLNVPWDTPSTTTVPLLKEVDDGIKSWKLKLVAFTEPVLVTTTV